MKKCNNCKAFYKNACNDNKCDLNYIQLISPSGHCLTFNDCPKPTTWKKFIILRRIK